MRATEIDLSFLRPWPLPELREDESSAPLARGDALASERQRVLLLAVRLSSGRESLHQCQYGAVP